MDIIKFKIDTKEEIMNRNRCAGIFMAFILFLYSPTKWNEKWIIINFLTSFASFYNSLLFSVSELEASYRESYKWLEMLNLKNLIALIHLIVIPIYLKFIIYDIFQHELKDDGYHVMRLTESLFEISWILANYSEFGNLPGLIIYISIFIMVNTAILINAINNEMNFIRIIYLYGGILLNINFVIGFIWDKFTKKRNNRREKNGIFLTIIGFLTTITASIWAIKSEFFNSITITQSQLK